MDRLDLGVVRRAVAARAKTGLGAARAAALGPLSAREEAIARIAQISEAAELHLREETPGLAGASDVGAALEQAEKDIVLDSVQLRAVAETLHAAGRLRRFLLAREDQVPRLYALGASLPELAKLANGLSSSFDATGQLADEASPALGPLRRRLRSLRGAVEERLAELMASTEVQAILQEQYFTVRADRYVLPVKASFKNELAGIVHDASGTGQTVFIEPQVVFEAGNRLKIAQAEVREEELRILGELTDRVVEEASGIRSSMEVVGDADFLFAAAALARDLDAEPIVPSAEPGFDLIRARHPELVLQRLADPATRLVPNDVGLEGPQRVLVLTGPNTGGKTVAMKTVGIAALLVRCGLHVPCDRRSRIGWFERIEVGIGDEQSIASKLSTFAAHVKQLTEMLGRADERTLALVDEIAADTDPTQGQALAQAVLEALAERGAHVIVTTHFEGLKAIPFADPRFRNAGVGFDPERFLPTYRLTLDVPQGSNGFDIAQALGMPALVVKRARALTGEGAQAIDAFMKQLEARSAEMERARHRAEEAEVELLRARRAAEDERRRLEDERKRLLHDAHAELLADIEKTRGEVRALVARLQSGAKEGPEAMRAANEAAERLAVVHEREKEKAPEVAEKLEQLEQVEVGAFVHVARLGKDGTVVALDGRQALVAVGNIRTRVPISSLRAPLGKPPKKGGDRARGVGSERPRPAAVIITSAEEIDVRGLPSDECLARIDGFLDHHYRGSATHIRVIHGHGTGALRAAIRAHLARSGYVRGWQPGDEKDGGDGVTVIELS